VKLAGKYGLHRTAKALRLDYYSLKKRVERDAVTANTPEQTAGIEPELLAGRVMIQITPQMRVVVAVEPADFRRGRRIESTLGIRCILAMLCRPRPSGTSCMPRPNTSSQSTPN